MMKKILGAKIVLFSVIYANNYIKNAEIRKLILPNMRKIAKCFGCNVITSINALRNGAEGR